MFAGSFDLEAVEAVTTDDEIGVDEVFELLAGLIDKSVVLREGAGAQARYRLLETIRAYGRERLSTQGRTDIFRRQHRDYYQRIAEDSERDWFGSDQVDWRHRLENERANLWAALEYCLSTPAEHAAGLRMAGALCYYWNAYGHLQDGRYWLGRALAADTRTSADRAKALWVNGWDAMTQGDNSSAMGCFDEGLAIAETLGDDTARAFVRQFRGSAEQFAGNLQVAEPLLRQAVEAHRQSGLVNSLTVLGTAQLGFVSCLLNRPERAVELCAECRTVSEHAGEQWAHSWATWVLGLARWTQGKYRDAGVALRDSLRAKQVLNDRLGISACAELLAWVAVEEDQPAHGAQLFGASRTLWASIGTPLFGSAAMLETREQYEDKARRILGPKAYDQDYQYGQRLKAAEAIELARGAHPARAGGSSATEQASLTRRQREVAELIAQGLTNKEIADKLVISQRTAEGHVEQVLVKMGFRSRTQVAAWLARQEGIDQGSRTN
ncbi:MAG TPA: LuxR C-terminal-related transcriptional regulator [Pseudonocardiaceae bacterium]|nr:LuxR C-terminal-related transcriptional regulator [Pseudonocardiaceae bacterium]